MKKGKRKSKRDEHTSFLQICPAVHSELEKLHFLWLTLSLTSWPNHEQVRMKTDLMALMHCEARPGLAWPGLAWPDPGTTLGFESLHWGVWPSSSSISGTQRPGLHSGWAGALDLTSANLGYWLVCWPGWGVGGSHYRWVTAPYRHFFQLLVSGRCVIESSDFSIEIIATQK